MAYLYINSRGQEVRRHSYSGGETFRFCAKKYELQRKRGYKDKEQKASKNFGMAMEDAVQHYHLFGLNLASALQLFEERWEQYKDQPVTYTSTDESWENLLLVGRDLLTLYHIKLPFMPFKTTPIPKFQTQFKKEVFPNTPLEGIEFIAYVDMIAGVKPDSGMTGEIVIDVKTSATMYSTAPGIHALDQQLRTYAWITGTNNVGFLVLVKTDRTIGRGSWVSFLRSFYPPTWNSGFEAGNMGVVVKTEADGVQAWVVKPDKNLDEMKAYVGDKPQTKDGKARKQAWLEQNAALVPVIYLTKQRVQFLPAYIDANAQQEAADQVGEDISMIVKANTANKWKKQGGTRFPNNKCVSCSMRGLCLDIPELRDALVERDELAEWEVGVEALF